ncbi:NAD-dependent epimerase/dehydratase family protein [Sphingomonas aracearum]|uniref:SDR family NAD-dependent epimerase/dehydratase n=1 Tax=Sphingomonas aracearum TaxID=2283317 RepID=A0A369W5N7_9SPHN|nr:SDR family oxidoreductase [Sphingomonas aracearum]RDE07401.1 SDR family NAD-dependent epimerase/dehydratase [Sphingomonas aracearum]
MKILITGNMGYVGPAVVRQLRGSMPDAVLVGYDAGFFGHALTTHLATPERLLDRQVFGDVRSLRPQDVEGYDAVVALAAVSNDPMGEQFARVTHAINQEAAVRTARMAAQAGVRNFVFASSCSVYGVAGDEPVRETDPTAPMTAYARSKLGTEQELADLDGDMAITCLRFATACGMSDRLRLDLVLNDFVASALAKGHIEILSDGTPWRPLIDVADMARAIEWGIVRSPDQGGRYLVVNAGAEEGNYQVLDLALAVEAALPGTTIGVAQDAPADSRSYRVDFSLFRSLAPTHQPVTRLTDSIHNLVTGLRGIGFRDPDFRNSRMIRLNVLRRQIAEHLLLEDLSWADGAPAVRPALQPEVVS